MLLTVVCIAARRVITIYKQIGTCQKRVNTKDQHACMASKQKYDSHVSTRFSRQMFDNRFWDIYLHARRQQAASF